MFGQIAKHTAVVEFVGATLFAFALLGAGKGKRGHDVNMKVAVALLVVGSVTGATMNPVFSFLKFVQGGVSLNDFVMNFAFQAVGTYAGAAGSKWYHGATKEKKSKESLEQLSSECLGCCVLTLCVLANVNTAIAFYVALNVSGCGLNPAYVAVQAANKSRTLKGAGLLVAAQLTGVMVALRLKSKM